MKKKNRVKKHEEFQKVIHGGKKKHKSLFRSLCDGEKGSGSENRYHSFQEDGKCRETQPDQAAGPDDVPGSDFL